MKKKDYELIAGAIHRSGMMQDGNRVKREAKERMRHLIAVDLAASLKHANPKFDIDRFMQICGFWNS